MKSDNPQNPQGKKVFLLPISKANLVESCLRKLTERDSRFYLISQHSFNKNLPFVQMQKQTLHFI